MAANQTLIDTMFADVFDGLSFTNSRLWSVECIAANESEPGH
jgi:hypothetical protein